MSRGLPATLPQLLGHCAARFGDRPAVTSREGLRIRAMSYRELESAANAVAADITMRHGLQKGQRVILQAPSSVQSVALLFGLFRAGIIATPMDLDATPAFVNAVREKTEAISILSPRGISVPAGIAHLAFEDIVFSGAADEGPPEPAPNDIAEIVFTSGTTGQPKGVALSHQNILCDLNGVSGVVPPGEELKLVSILPLSHMFEQTVGLFLPILFGGSVHYVESLRPNVILSAMRRHQVTGMAVVPRFLEILMAATQDKMSERKLGWIWRIQHRIASALPIDLRRWVFLPLHQTLGGKLRFFLCGGAALSPDVMRAWERMGVRIIEGYGATECAPVIASNSFNDRVPGSVGHPIDVMSVRISTEGELQVKGPNVFGGYWEDAARTSAAFTEDGWYRTDDIAAAAPDKRLRIIGRLTDRIVLPSGMNVFPKDVEAVLSDQPSIAESVVLGLPDEQGSDHVHALIRPTEGTDESAAARSVASANAELADHQRITGFTLWQNEFPRTPLQKIKRAELRKSAVGQIQLQATEAEIVDTVGQIDHLLRQVSRRSPAMINENTRLDTDLGLDSLGRVELTALVERETGYGIPEAKIAELVTVGDLVAELSRPQQKAAVIRYSKWPRLRSVVSIRSFLHRGFLFLLHRLFAKTYTVEGCEELVEAEGPFLIIANHASHFDTLSILRALPDWLRRKTAVAAAADYFFSHRWSSFLAALILNAFPFSRGGQVRSSLDQCGLLVDDGWSVLIYPEGTRSPDGRLLPFKAGIGLLATGLGIPVVPVSVAGGEKVLPKSASWPRRAAVVVRFGRPLTIPPLTAPAEATRLLHRAVSQGLPGSLKTSEDEPHAR